MAITCTAGTASASAQGQVMMSTATALSSAGCQGAKQQPDGEGGERQHMHRRRVEPGDAVGERDEAGAALLGRLDQPHDLRQEGALAGGGHA